MSNSSENWFGKLFKRGSQPEQKQDAGVAPKPTQDYEILGPVFFWVVRPKADPRNAAAWYNKGNSLSSLGRFEEAISSYDKALALNPRDVDAWTNKAGSLGSLGRHEEAILSFDKALALNPRVAMAWSNKGSSLGSLGRFEEALGCLDKALELDPHYALAWFNKALAEDKLSKWQEAALSYEQFLALVPAQYVGPIEYAHKRLQELEDE